MTGAALLLVNPNAGRVDDDAVAATAAAVPSGWDLEVVVTERPEDVPGVVDRLDGRRLLLMGGDGTLHVAVGVLRDQDRLDDVPVGFLPAGTANAFARGVGLPLAPPDAVPVALDGRCRPLDLLVSDAGHVGVNDLHTGLGVPATHLSRRLKPVLRQLTYPVANTLTGLFTPGWGIEVLVDGEPVVEGERRSLAVMIGNGHLIGDGTEMWPGARPDDGELDVVALLASRRWQRVGLGLAVKDGRHVDRDDVRRTSGRTVALRGDVPGHNSDGELYDDAGETSWTVQPSAWRLRC